MEEKEQKQEPVAPILWNDFDDKKVSLPKKKPPGKIAACTGESDNAPPDSPSSAIQSEPPKARPASTAAKRKSKDVSAMMQRIIRPSTTPEKPSSSLKSSEFRIDVSKLARKVRKPTASSPRQPQYPASQHHDDEGEAAVIDRDYLDTQALAKKLDQSQSVSEEPDQHRAASRPVESQSEEMPLPDAINRDYLDTRALAKKLEQPDPELETYAVEQPPQLDAIDSNYLDTQALVQKLQPKQSSGAQDTSSAPAIQTGPTEKSLPPEPAVIDSNALDTQSLAQKLQPEAPTTEKQSRQRNKARELLAGISQEKNIPCKQSSRPTPVSPSKDSLPDDDAADITEATAATEAPLSRDRLKQLATGTQTGITAKIKMQLQEEYDTDKLREQQQRYQELAKKDELGITAKIKQRIEQEYAQKTDEADSIPDKSASQPQESLSLAAIKKKKQKKLEHKPVAGDFKRKKMLTDQLSLTAKIKMDLAKKRVSQDSGLSMTAKIKKSIEEHNVFSQHRQDSSESTSQDRDEIEPPSLNFMTGFLWVIIIGVLAVATVWGLEKLFGG